MTHSPSRQLAGKPGDEGFGYVLIENKGWHVVMRQRSLALHQRPRPHTRERPALVQA
jgi:hypothetical protein